MENWTTTNTEYESRSQTILNLAEAASALTELVKIDGNKTGTVVSRLLETIATINKKLAAEEEGS